MQQKSSMTIQHAEQILGIEKAYTIESVKKKYHMLSKKYHLDMNQNISAEEQNQFEKELKKINEAYKIIKKSLQSQKTFTEVQEKTKQELINILDDYGNELKNY